MLRTEAQKAVTAGYIMFVLISVTMAVAELFSKNGYTVPNKIANILEIFDRLEELKL